MKAEFDNICVAFCDLWPQLEYICDRQNDPLTKSVSHG